MPCNTTGVKCTRKAGAENAAGWSNERGAFGTEQDPVGPSQDRARPIPSAAVPLSGACITGSDAHFLSCFTAVKTPPNGRC